MIDLRDEVKQIQSDLAAERSRPHGPELDLSNLPTDCPACIEHILKALPPKSDRVDFNKLSLNVSCFLKAKGYTLQGALGIAKDFIEKYSDSATHNTPQKRKANFESVWKSINNGGYKFDCAYILGLHLPGSAFECKRCAVSQNQHDDAPTDKAKDDPPADHVSSARNKQEPSKFPPKSELEITESEWTVAQIAPPCIVEKYLYADVATLTAPGGTGKTTLQLFEMIHIVLGRDLYGLKVIKRGWCLLFTAEDTREICIARIREICAAMGLSPEEIAQVRRDIVILDTSDFGMNLICMQDGNIIVSPDVDAIIARYKDDPPALGVFDPAASFGVGEAKVNDNEQGLVNAARKIRNAFKCCVRIVCHTGKANAREKTLDQYTSRGGSALPDGSRMVAVMQAWSPETRIKLPQGCKADSDSSITVLARPKLSYAKGNLPSIFIRRTGWAFEHFTEVFFSEEETQQAVKDQVLRFLKSQEAEDVLHSKNSLETNATKMSLTREGLRGATSQLIAEGKLIEKRLPKERCQGGKTTYLAVA